MQDTLSKASAGATPGGGGLGCGFWGFEATVKMANHGVSAGLGDKEGKPEEANAAYTPLVSFTTSDLL